PLYGFHNKERTFLKIYLYNPYSVKKVADLLLSGMVLKKVMQPHEAHIPFALQAGGMNPGLSALWRDEEERRARRGDASTLVAPLSHDRLGVMKTDSELFYIRKLDKLLRAAQSTDR
ncbi:unnamed protein product, partial [Ixodes persulcatus]